MSDKPLGSQYVDPPEGYEGPNKWMDHSGFRIMVGPGRSPFLLNEISQKIRSKLPVIIMVSGPPGSGKSYLALRSAEMLDLDFVVTTHVPMDRRHFLELIGPESPLDRGSVIVSDEAQFLMSARRWFDETQKDLMEQLEAIRSKGYIVVIVALHIELMDVIVRDHILNYFIYLEKPGLATVYRLFTGRFDRERKYWRMGQTQLLLPGDEDCNDPGCLTCKHSGLRKTIWRKKDKWEEIGFRPCMNMRVVYERLKREKLDLINIASLEKLKAKEMKEKAIGDVELLEVIFDNKHIIARLSNGKLDPTSISYVVEDITGVRVPHARSYTLRKKFGFKYPELKVIKETGD